MDVHELATTLHRNRPRGSGRPRSWGLPNEIHQAAGVATEQLIELPNNMPYLPTTVCVVSLTQGQVALIDDCFGEAVAARKWCAWKAPTGRTFYAFTTIDGRSVGLHNFIAGLLVGSVPAGWTVDHSDHNGLDNRCSNLRFATPGQQSANRRKQRNNTSGLTGVAWNKARAKWMAYAKAGGRQKTLGYFADPIEAARVRDAFMLEHHREFAELNFPPSTAA